MAAISEMREKLKKRIDFLRGDFTLASGKKSDFYINGKTTTLRPDALNYAARLFIEMLREAKPDRVGGPRRGRPHRRDNGVLLRSRHADGRVHCQEGAEGARHGPVD